MMVTPTLFTPDSNIRHGYHLNHIQKLFGTYLSMLFLQYVCKHVLGVTEGPPT